MHDQVEREENSEGDQGGLPADQKHDGHTQQKSDQRQPDVVKLKKG